jgi:hypothetical protein
VISANLLQTSGACASSFCTSSFYASSSGSCATPIVVGSLCGHLVHTLSKPLLVTLSANYSQFHHVAHDLLELVAVPMLLQVNNHLSETVAWVLSTLKVIDERSGYHCQKKVVHVVSCQLSVVLLQKVLVGR